MVDLETLNRRNRQLGEILNKFTEKEVVERTVQAQCPSFRLKGWANMEDIDMTNAEATVRVECANCRSVVFIGMRMGTDKFEVKLPSECRSRETIIG